MVQKPWVMRGKLWWLVGALVWLAIACQAQKTPTPAGPAAVTPVSFKLETSAFAPEGAIPARFTCDGEDVSPELRWRDAPSGTKSFVLIMDDPDAPGGTFTHWVLFNIPATQTSLSEGQRPGQVGVSGRNDFGRTGYGGPCPPQGRGPHRYFFKLYALDVEALNLKEGATRRSVEQAMQGHVIGQAELMGRYERR